MMYDKDLYLTRNRDDIGHGREARDGKEGNGRVPLTLITSNVFVIMLLTIAMMYLMVLSIN